MKITSKKMESLVLNIRGLNVLMDSDLATLYEIETKRLNEAVKRNIERFPSDFMFQLNQLEFNALKEQNLHGGRRVAPYVFTEQGVAMLSSVLNTKKAISINIQIMRVFVKMRELTSSHKKLEQKISDLENKYDKQFQVVFDTLRETLVPALKKDRKKIGLKKK